MKRKFSLYGTLSQWLRLPLAGPLFRLYAPRRKWNAVAARTDRSRVLIANLMPSLGDTICYMALAEVIRDALPWARITWMADSPVAGLVAQHPDVDQVLTITSPPSFLERIPTLKTYYRLYTIMRAVQRLEIAEPFDLAIVPRGGIDPSFSAHAVWMLNLPRSAGYSHLVEPNDIEHAFPDGLFTDLETKITVLHEAARGVQLLEKTGLVPDALARFDDITTRRGLRGLRTIAASRNRDTVLAKAGVPLDKPFIVLSPGAGVPNRSWPGKSFHELCELIIANTDFNVVITGTNAEMQLCSLVADGLAPRAISCAGAWNLGELISLLSHATAFVGNDSGAGHIAGPLGIPVISLHTQAKGSDPYHIRAPQHGRPLGKHVTVIQPEAFLAPCTDRCDDPLPHCIAQIPVQEVWRALKLALNI